ncbi:hypothetical protein D082_50220 (plasmid) [Synechocystis sp. PCC 6714]|nr:hypothetical protein D082_50220 [Synechocystis sp. PCC 6714]
MPVWRRGKIIAQHRRNNPKLCLRGTLWRDPYLLKRGYKAQINGG